MRASSGVRFIFAVPIMLWGCGDIIGLDGYTDNDSSTDATSDAQGDVIGSDVVPQDGGSDVTPTCNLQTSVCVPDLPSGWAFTIYDPDTRPACATGYGAQTDVEEGIDAGAAVCTCGCTTTNPDCHTGKLGITGGNNGGCNNFTNQTDVATAGCNTLTQFTTTNGNQVSTTPPAPSGGSCTPSGTQTIPAVGYGHQGRTCAFEAGAPGGGCTTGQVCLPSPGTFDTCVSQAGNVACPADAGYPTQHVIGSSITDTRGCTTCGCAFDAGSCGGTVTLWTDTGCANNSTPIAATGTCTNVNGNRTWKGYSYVASTTASCSGTPVAADGGVVFADVTTVCCK
jgi:hypothetical protein